MSEELSFRQDFVTFHLWNCTPKIILLKFLSLQSSRISCKGYGYWAALFTLTEECLMQN